jgi:RNA polymerase sigma-70 factor (ECF subfamily)
MALALELVVLSSAPRERKTPVPLQLSAETIEACRRGDREAQDVVLRAHAEILERLLSRLIGPSAEVEDLLQETFAIAIEAFSGFRGEASVRTWLHRIAVNVARHHLRKPLRRRQVQLDDSTIAATTPDASDSLASNDTARALYEHLDAIDAVKRIALVLHVIDERPIAEVAALMGASHAATKSRIFWARRALLKRLRRDPRFADQGGQP